MAWHGVEDKSCAALAIFRTKSMGICATKRHGSEEKDRLHKAAVEPVIGREKRPLGGRAGVSVEEGQKYS